MRNNHQEWIIISTILMICMYMKNKSLCHVFHKTQEKLTFTYYWYNLKTRKYIKIYIFLWYYIIKNCNLSPEKLKT